MRQSKLVPLVAAVLALGGAPRTPAGQPVHELVVEVAGSGPAQAGIPVSVRDNTPPWTGNLTIRVTGTPVVELVQVDPAGVDGHPVTVAPGGHQRAWVFTGRLSGVAVQDTRPGQPGWAVTGQVSDLTGTGSRVPAGNLGWTPVLAKGSDAEGTVTAGTGVDPVLKTAASRGLGAPGTMLATAPSGSGLGVENLSASVVLWLPDTTPSGVFTGTLTLTLTSP
jgi:hypothetical protein